MSLMGEEGKTDARGVVAGSASESKSGAASEPRLKLALDVEAEDVEVEGLLVLIGMAMGEMPSGGVAISLVRRAVGFPKRFERTRCADLLSAEGTGAEESEVSSTVSRVGGVLRFFLIEDASTAAETLDSLRTREPCWR